MKTPEEIEKLLEKSKLEIEKILSDNGVTIDCDEMYFYLDFRQLGDNKRYRSKEIINVPF